MAVAAGVLQVDLVVADDAVVEVGHVETAVGPELQIDRPEPPVVARHEIGRLLDPRRRTPPLRDIAMDDVGHDVAHEHRPAILCRKLVGLVGDHAGDAGRAVAVARGERRVAEAVVRLAEAVVIAAAEDHHDRLGMAVSRELVAHPVEAHAERVHLPPRHLLDRGAVGAEAIGVTGGHFKDNIPLATEFYFRRVAEAVAGVDPAIGPEPEGVLVTVGVGKIEWPVEHLAAIRLAVAIGVGELPDVGDRPDDHRLAATIRGTARQRQHADRNIEAVGKERGLRGAAVGPKALEHGEPVPRLGSGGEGILDRVGHPEPAAIVERQVHRLLDLRLAGNELDLKAGGQLELGPLLGR